MSERVSITAEVAEGIRCVMCEQRYGYGDGRDFKEVGTAGSTAHVDCWELPPDPEDLKEPKQ